MPKIYTSKTDYMYHMSYFLYFWTNLGPIPVELIHEPMWASHVLYEKDTFLTFYVCFSSFLTMCKQAFDGWNTQHLSRLFMLCNSWTAHLGVLLESDSPSWAHSLGRQVLTKVVPEDFSRGGGMGDKYLWKKFGKGLPWLWWRSTVLSFFFQFAGFHK